MGAWYEALCPRDSPIAWVTLVSREVWLGGPGMPDGLVYRSHRDFWESWAPVRPETIRWLDQGAGLESWMTPGRRLIANRQGPLHYHRDRPAEIVVTLGGLVFWKWSDSIRQLDMFSARYLWAHLVPIDGSDNPSPNPPPTIWDRLG